MGRGLARRGGAGRSGAGLAPVEALAGAGPSRGGAWPDGSEGWWGRDPAGSGVLGPASLAGCTCATIIPGTRHVYPKAGERVE